MLYRSVEDGCAAGIDDMFLQNEDGMIVTIVVDGTPTRQVKLMRVKGSRRRVDQMMNPITFEDESNVLVESVEMWTRSICQLSGIKGWEHIGISERPVPRDEMDDKAAAFNAARLGD